jgi:hypothetical protein
VSDLRSEHLTLIQLKDAAQYSQGELVAERYRRCLDSSDGRMFYHRQYKSER